MLHLYFFTSSRKSDKIGCMTILTTSATKAFAFACANFAKNNCKGKPIILAI